MVQRKTCQATESYNNLQPETRFGQEHLKSLGPEMMTMKKRTKPKRKVIDSPASQSGTPQSTPKKHDLVVAKGTGMSPNYMKGTSSSEARKLNKSRLNNLTRIQKNQIGSKHDSRHGVNNKPSSRMVRGLTKAPSFKRCSQRATCSSTLKDSKFPDYLMLHDDEAVSGTSVLKVCPYTYCSLNGHLHKQYPPLKSFISSRRRSLKSQKKACKEDVVEMYVEEKKEYEVEVGTQISEALSEGAPRSETDSDDYFDTKEMVKLSESDMEETFVAESVKEMQETYEADDYYSEKAEMVKTSEAESGQSDLEESLVNDSVKDTFSEVNDESDSEEMVRFLEGDHDLEETLLDESVKEIQENSEVIDAGEETLKDNKAEDHKAELQDQTEETTKVPYKRKQKPCNQEESDATISWTITKGKKPVAETEDLKDFNPREPNYLPLVPDADAEKVDLKHQDIDERRNSEDWMFDYALQRAVTKLSSARKKKVALLVEAFETVKPVMPHGRSYGRHLQTCN
ncbi:Plant calmodulin-binding protein-related [Raphanus sativus]|uniref:Calmodulin binding protein PICBP n=1 Tax=Raphanus sativus TaxID=3726 RepID=A0A6J0K1V4_RAPSA|nr:calmodulin binding protein PICBP [Raphanus sativus]KAJ4891939.1 Plant calmodulin-binding protein-related [Raphanus sativus]